MCNLRGKPVVTFSHTRADPTLGHEPLVPAHINVEDIDVELRLPFYRFGHIPACKDSVPGEFAKDGFDGALLRTVPLFQCFDHLMVSVRVVEVDVKRWLIVVMGFGYSAILCPEVNTMISVRGIKDPHDPTPVFRSPGARGS
jgi:hypothetical protein